MIAKLSKSEKKQIQSAKFPPPHPHFPLSSDVIICHTHVAKTRTRDFSALLNLAEAA